MKRLTALLLYLYITALGYAQAQTRDFVQTDAVKVTGITNDSLLFSLGVTGRQTSRVYIDGVGRGVQGVAVKASPLQTDLIQPIVYDSLGRQSKGYLPYASHDGNGGFRPSALTEQSTFFNGVNGSTIAHDSKPWSEQLFENSPLQRVFEAGSVGNGFQPTGTNHFKTMNYRTNTTGDAVQIWLPGATAGSGIYAAGLLNVADGIDEEGNEALSFTNDNGQLVLKRQKASSSTWLNTYYIYNEAGMMSYVVPPQATAIMAAASDYSLSHAGVDALLFKMSYDARGRLVVKKVPSAGEMYVIYDPFDRPVLMQDANLRVSHKWNYIKYDVKGRAIAQGTYTDATYITRVDMQAYVNGLTYTNYYEDRNTSITYGYYTNNVFPTSGIIPLAYSYYDDYFITNGSMPDYAYVSQGLSGESTAETLVNGMMTAIRKKTVGTGMSPTWLINVVFYDSKGRTIQSQGNNQLYTTVADKSTLVTDFEGKPRITKVTKNSSSSASVTVQTAYAYDHANRVLTVDQSYNGGTAKRVAFYQYNVMGQLIKKNLGRLNSGTSYPNMVTLRSTIGVTTNTIAQQQILLDNGFRATATSAPLIFTAKIKTDYLQAMNYRYNIRGQLLSINNSTLTRDTSNNDAFNAVFGMEMIYDQADSGLGNTPYYNGRLSAVKWRTKSGDAYSTPGSERGYLYNYDPLNRMTDAFYKEKVTGGSWAATGAFDEKNVTYYENGNIKTLKRNGVIGGAITAIDDLNYSYDGNQLTNVTDGTGTNYTANGFKNLAAYGGSTPYAYDDNGNLKTDLKKGITNTYNVLNRVDVTTITAGTNKFIKYIYDAGGSLLRKLQYNGSATVPVKTTDYLGGFVYENGTLVYFAAAEGRVRVSGSTLTNEYVITDTQGNSRVSFEDNGSGVAVVRQENSYYPFGLIMNNGITPGTNPNKNLYNGGSEWQNDFVDLPDYYQTFFRNYDAAIGRFVGVDPMGSAVESLTPYQYANNNPGMLNDPMGDLVDVNTEPIYKAQEEAHFNQADIDRMNQGYLAIQEMLLYSKFGVEAIYGKSYASGGDIYGGGLYGSYEDAMEAEAEKSMALYQSVMAGAKTAYNRERDGTLYDFQVRGNVVETEYGQVDHDDAGDPSGPNRVILRTYVGDPLGKGNAKDGGLTLNQFIYNFGIGAATMQNFTGKIQLGNNLKIHFPNNAGRVYKGNQWGKTLGFAETGKYLGWAGAAFGIGMDIRGMFIYHDNPYADGAVSPGKFGADAFMTGVGLTGFGTLPAAFYFGIDAYYPGGFPAAMKNAVPVYNQLYKPSAAPSQLWGMP